MVAGCILCEYGTDVLGTGSIFYVSVAQKFCVRAARLSCFRAWQITMKRYYIQSLHLPGIQIPSYPCSSAYLS